jgi:hypothetical protein
MIVVASEHLDDPRIAVQSRMWSDEDANCACTNEAVDEILGQPTVDLMRAAGRTLTSI